MVTTNLILFAQQRPMQLDVVLAEKIMKGLTPDE